MLLIMLSESHDYLKLCNKIVSHTQIDLMTCTAIVADLDLFPGVILNILLALRVAMVYVVSYITTLSVLISIELKY